MTVPVYAPGIWTGATIDASANNIPIAFSSAAGSKMLTNLRLFLHRQPKHMQLINTTGTDISITPSNTDDGIPSSTTTQRAVCPAGYTITLDLVECLDTLYIQSEGSAITTGKAYLTVW